MDWQNVDWQDVPVGGSQAADEHIRQIRISHGLDNSHVPRDMVENLEQACKVLANQLYEASTHFLLEIIQNTDDNKYTADEPTLVITYRKDYIQVECNEVGFSPENVKAICSLGRSSKKKPGEATNSTGEKGIGFKSVFRVADVVWVSSGDYNFKFDSTKPLGMIAPIPDKFPRDKRPGWTSFYLQLRQGPEGPKLRQEIFNQLTSLDSRLLLFLRKLRAINLDIQDASGKTQISEIRRTSSTWDGHEIINLTKNGLPSKYLMHRHKVNAMPLEERRDKVKTSEVVLAFPLDEAYSPVVEPQQAFAYLPISDFGFSFVLQADFLLTANRESVERSNKWNQALRSGLVQAFENAAGIFNDGALKYTWIRYLPEQSSPTTFFGRLKQDLLESLRKKSVLRAWDETLQRPDCVIYVPEKYRDRTGAPITLPPPKASLYLSNGYDNDDHSFFERLSIREMDDDVFTANLRTLLKSHFQDFANKPPEWHNSLARVLNQMPLNKMHLMRDLKMVKLRTGQWVSTISGNVFFPGEAGYTVPNGINLQVVDPAVSGDPAQRQLYSRLAVTQFDIFAVQKMIVDLHSSESPPSLSIEDFVAQVLFLYSTAWAKTDDARLWVVTQTGKRVKADSAYIDDDGPHAAKTLFAKDQLKFNFLHADYYKAQPHNRAGWLKWIEDTLGASKLPHLVENKATRTIAPDFRYLMTHLPSEKWLEVLCENWKSYSKWLDEDSEGADPQHEYDRRRLRIEFNNTMVVCTNGTACKLINTWLPLEEFKTAAGSSESTRSVPLLRVLDPKNDRWKHLKALGVGVEHGVDFYLLCLSKLSESGTLGKLPQFKFLMNQIQARCRSDDEQRVRAHFWTVNNNKPLIFVPSPKPFAAERYDAGRMKSPFADPDDSSSDDGTDEEDEAALDGRWLPVKKCLWNAPRYFRVHAGLSEIYPGNKSLLKDILQISDVTFTHLIDEARSFTLNDPLRYMTRILVCMDRYVAKKGISPSEVIEVNSLCIWPVGMPDETIQLRSALSNSQWFIADRSHWRRFFGHVIPILLFDVDEQYRIRRLLRSLGLGKRFITEASQKVPSTVGRVELSQAHTDLFRSKYSYIARLVNCIDDIEDKELRLMRLKNLEVFTAERMVELHTIKYCGKDVQGIPSKEDAIVMLGSARFEIYMRLQYFETDKTLEQLTTALGWALGMNPAKHGAVLRILGWVLAENDSIRLSDLLNKYGIPQSIEEENEDDAWIGEPQGSSHTTATAGYSSWRIDGQGGDPLIISSTNAHNFTHLFIIDERPQVETYDARLKSRLSRFSKLPFKIFTPTSKGQKAEAFFGFYEDKEVEDNLQYLGELQVAKQLRQILGDKYVPSDHWTSPLRTRSGLAPPAKGTGSADAGDEPGPAFTITDPEGRFTSALAQSGSFEEAKYWKRKPPTWHIEVKATKGGLSEEFALTGEQFDRARMFWMRRGVMQAIPTDVLILVRVFNLDSKPQMAFFIEPWKQYLEGKLEFKCRGRMMGRPASTS